MTAASLNVLTRCFPGRPVYDTAVSHAILRRVGAGTLGPTLRLYRPDDVVVFSLLDARRPGFGAAVERAREAGFGAVLRLGGGHAAVFHRDTLAFSWSRPIAELRTGICERFVEMASLTCEALQALGVDARVGEVEGEYCPGEHSVNARGRTKLMGVGQRVIRGAAHVGGVVVAGGTDRVRDVLVPVYEALELDWDPATVGSVSDEVGATSVDALRAALLDAFRALGPTEDVEPDADTLALAGSLEDWHRPGADPRNARRLDAKTLEAR